LEITRDPTGRAARAANALRGRARVPVRITAETGPLFRLRSVEVLDSRDRQPLTVENFPPRALKLQPGDPARSADLRSANARLVDYYRARSYPLVKAPLPSPVVDHATDSMDVAYLVDPGPKAGIGTIALTGPQTFDQAIVRSFIYLEPGDPYSPEALDRMRRSVASIPAVGSVRVREGTALDAVGNLPIFVEVTDRAPNLIGFSAGYSTLDGRRAGSITRTGTCSAGRSGSGCRATRSSRRATMELGSRISATSGPPISARDSPSAS
jgi:translocation and assembly module TamA